MNKIDQSLFYFIATVLFINLVLVIGINITILDRVILISVCIIGILFYNEIFLISNSGKLLIFSITSITTLLLTSYINQVGNSGSVKVFYFILMYQLYRKVKVKRAILFFLFIFTLDTVISVQKSDVVREKIQLAASNFLLFALISTIIILVIYTIRQNRLLETAHFEIMLKNTQLEHKHDDLLKTYNKLEEYTIIKERSKIARELHDSVGHNLTIALVELEVGKMQIDQDLDEAKARLTGGITQVRRGLAELRASVKTLKEDIDYLSEINDLLTNSEKHTGISIKSRIDPKVERLDNKMLSCVYRVIQEGLTNGIKHGGASVFLVNWTISNKDMHLSLENNGKGTSTLNKGFGINAMEERIKELNGEIRFEYSKSGGFGIFVTIPLKGNYDD